MEQPKRKNKGFNGFMTRCIKKSSSYLLHGSRELLVLVPVLLGIYVCTSTLPIVLYTTTVQYVPVHYYVCLHQIINKIYKRNSLITRLWTYWISESGDWIQERNN